MSEEQILNKEKLRSVGFTEENTKCKHTYKIKNICEHSGVDCNTDDRIEVTDVLCDTSALEQTYCKQYIANIEMNVDGKTLSFTQNVACVYKDSTVENSGIRGAAGFTILIMVGIALGLGLAALAFINVRLRNKMKDLESIENKNHTGTVNAGMNFEEG